MKVKTVLTTGIFLLMPPMLFISFSQHRTEWQGMIEEVNGVVVIKNPKEPMYGGDVLDLKEELCIGKTDGKDNYSFYRVWYLAVKNYELQVFNAQGELSKKIIKEYEPVKITEEDVKRRVRRVPEDRKLVVPKYFPAVHSITTDDKGRIFVHTYEKAGEGKYYNDVFDSEGRYIAKVALKDLLQVWKKSKLYTIEEDEEGYQMVKRYKVTWKI